MSDEKPKTQEERARELNRAFLDRVAESVRLNTRGKILSRLEESRVRCPLCHGRFEKMVDFRSPLHPQEVLICHACKVGINVKDPFVGQWERGLGADGNAKPIPCPRCESPMRFFCTSTGYWRAECWATISVGAKGRRKCGATLSAAQPDRKPGVTVAPREDGKDVVDRPVATPDDPGALVTPDDPTPGPKELLQ